MGITIGYGGTAAAEAQQLAVATFFEFFVLAKGFHAFAVKKIIERRCADVAQRTLEAATCHDLACGEDRQVAVPAVATIVNGVGIQAFGDVEKTSFIEE